MEHKKRKNEQEVEPCSSKRSKIQTTRQSGLLDLSDDVLLLILQNLQDGQDLLNLQETCTRLQRVTADESLWVFVSTKDSPLPPQRFRKILKFLGPKTQSVIIGGRTSSKTGEMLESITPAILASISQKCPQLEEFTFESCLINAEQYVTNFYFEKNESKPFFPSFQNIYFPITQPDQKTFLQ